ncbi:translation initiation factor IF-2-like [Trichosurus vulpecula]|uniref:translation initiation factor IF-2-like n=1 Tax=Trichosurus vulpecula TaxID=9337 RepID=UPI00186B06EE|nr:translation initiation factor IF-2-like [Trichosurus vulpecula]
MHRPRGSAQAAPAGPGPRVHRLHLPGMGMPRKPRAPSLDSLKPGASRRPASMAALGQIPRSVGPTSPAHLPSPGLCPAVRPPGAPSASAPPRLPRQDALLPAPKGARVSPPGPRLPPTPAHTARSGGALAAARPRSPQPAPLPGSSPRSRRGPAPGTASNLSRRGPGMRASAAGSSLGSRQRRLGARTPARPRPRVQGPAPSAAEPRPRRAPSPADGRLAAAAQAAQKTSRYRGITASLGPSPSESGAALGGRWWWGWEGCAVAWWGSVLRLAASQLALGD